MQLQNIKKEKTICLGDTHGRQDWKKIVEQPFDRVIFIGDYLDTREDITPLEQLENLREIILFKQFNLNKVILLIGNHDYHYWPGIDERYSGYQPQMRASFEYEFRQFGDMFQMAHEQDGIMFTHAGVTEEWLKNNNLTKDDPHFFLLDQINDLFKHQPSKFGFCGFDPYGDNITQSPIWVRPRSLMKDHVKGYKQVVGHTTMKKIEPMAYNEDIDKFYFIDTLGMSGEYLVIEDGTINIMKDEL